MNKPHSFIFLSIFSVLFVSKVSLFAQSEVNLVHYQSGGDLKFYSEPANSRIQYSVNAGFRENSSSKSDRHFTVNERFNLDISTIEPTCEYANGSIIVAAARGNAPYMFSINNSPYQSSGRFIQLGGGNHTVSVRDASGAIVTSTVTLTNSFKRPTGEVVATTPSGCSALDVTSTITATSGTAPFTYSMDRANYQAENVFKNLPAGWYTYYMKDANGCVVNINGTSVNNCSLGSTLSYSWGVCENEGIVNISNTSGGTAPYSYSMDGVNYQQETAFTGITAGLNKLYVKDATGLISITGLPMVKSCFLHLDIKTSIAHCGKNDGKIIVTPLDGSGPFGYSIDGTTFQQDNTFSNLAAGNYTVVAMDANGMIVQYPDNLISPGCMTIGANATETDCTGKNGSITAAASAGTEPYQYSLDGTNYQLANTFKNLSVGDYIVYAKDAGGDIKTTNVSVNSSAGLVISVKSTNTDCDQATGKLQITGSGGISPFQFSIDGTKYQDANTFDNLSYGQYSIYLKDAAGCVATNCCTLIDYKCLKLSVSKSDSKCHQNTGSLTVSSENGKAPFEYSIDGLNFQDNPYFDQLGGGTYTIITKDNTGLTGSISATINDACILLSFKSNSSKCNRNNGGIVVNASNGKAPYKYSIDGIHFQDSEAFNGLGAGNYDVTVSDSQGLTANGTVSIKDIAGPQLKLAAEPATCNNNDGSVEAFTIKGTAPFSFAINNGAFTVDSTFRRLVTGMYEINVTDANGCKASQQVAVPLYNDLTVEAGEDVTICEETNTVLQSSSNGTNFSWTPSKGLSTPSASYTNASPAETTKYYITATKTLCRAIDSVIVFVNKAPIAEAGDNIEICYGKDVQLNGGGGIKYSWQPSTYLSDKDIYNPIVKRPAVTTTYYLTVTDENGCLSIEKSPVKITVTPPTKINTGNDTTLAIGQPLQLAVKDVNNSMFNQFYWSPATGLNNPNIQNPVATLYKDQTYIITAIAPGNCIGTDTIKIKVFKGPEIYIPTGFTPNQDGHNDFLKVTTVGITKFNYFSIYNRWGQQVFYSTVANKGWDGTVNGIPLTTDTFVWIASGIDYNGNLIQKRGTVVLLR